MTKKVSMITTTFNDTENLKKTIERVRKQDYDNIEYIIVDGGSGPETLALIREAEQSFGDRLKWISEPDKGIYDAINKGIRMATGDIVGVMFDEMTSEHVVSQMVQAMETEQTDGVHGDINYMDGDRIVRKWRMGQGNLRNGWMPGHPTLYLKKEVYDTYGLYKTDYKIAADYEFMIRILKDNNVKLSYIDQVLVHMFYGGTSTGGFSNYMLSLKEGHRALKENGIQFACWTDFMRTMRVLLQFIR